MDPRLYGKIIGGQEIRMFREESIQDAIGKALSGAKKNSATVDVLFPGEGRIRGIAMANLETEEGYVWSAAVIGEMKDGKLDEAGFRLAFEW